MIIIVLLFYIALINNKINKTTPFIENKKFKWLLCIIYITAVSIIFMILMPALSHVFLTVIERYSELNCQDDGLSKYCTTNSLISLIILIPIGITITIKHFVCQEVIYEMFRYTKSFIKHIINYIYMFFIFACDIWLAFALMYGTRYTSLMVEVFKIFIIVLPFSLFYISTAIHSKKYNKSQLSTMDKF